MASSSIGSFLLIQSVLSYWCWPNILGYFDVMSLPYLNVPPWFLWQGKSRLDNETPAIMFPWTHGNTCGHMSHVTSTSISLAKASHLVQPIFPSCCLFLEGKDFILFMVFSQFLENGRKWTNAFIFPLTILLINTAWSRSASKHHKAK